METPDPPNDTQKRASKQVSHEKNPRMFSFYGFLESPYIWEV